jgi:hypothetical protein
VVHEIRSSQAINVKLEELKSKGYSVTSHPGAEIRRRNGVTLRAGRYFPTTGHKYQHRLSPPPINPMKRFSLPLRAICLNVPRNTRLMLVTRLNSTVALTEQRGRKLTPWLRAMKEIRQRGTDPPQLPRAELTLKRMHDSEYAVKLPFSTDEVLELEGWNSADGQGIVRSVY